MATCTGDIWPRAIRAVSSKGEPCLKDTLEPKAVQPKKEGISVKKRFKNLSLDLCRGAIEDCFKGKWGRNDILTFVEKYAGIRRQEFWTLWLEDPENMKLRNEAIDAIAPMIMETVEEIERGHDPEDMEPVTIRPRPDGMTGKIRDIAMLCVLHQILGHVAKLMIDPLLRARIEPTQHASIPGRGQTKLKDQTAKLLRAEKEYKRDGHLREIRAEKVISCNSYISQSDSNGIKEKYHVDELMKEAKRVASRRTKRERKEKKERIENALYGRGYRQAQKGHDRKAPGRKEKDPSDGQRNKKRRRGDGNIILL